MVSHRSYEPEPQPGAVRQIWDQLRERISFRVLRVSLILVVVGGALVARGCNENKLASASSQTPETMSLKKLIERGPDGNPNIVLTDFQLCPNYVAQGSSLSKVEDGNWSRVWAPIVPRENHGDASPIALAPGNIRALIVSSHISNENQLVSQLGVPQLRGMVTNQISSLSSKEKQFLQKSYPGVDFDQCLIFEEGRKPVDSGTISAYQGGGALVILLGLALLAKGFFFD